MDSKIWIFVVYGFQIITVANAGADLDVERCSTVLELENNEFYALKDELQ